MFCAFAGFSVNRLNWYINTQSTVMKPPLLRPFQTTALCRILALCDTVKLQLQGLNGSTWWFNPVISQLGHGLSHFLSFSFLCLLSSGTVVHFLPFSFSALLFPSVHHGISADGDFLLPEPRRGDRVCGHFSARLIRRFKSGKRGFKPLIRYFTNSTKTQRIQKTRAVSSAKACVLLADIVHHQYMWHIGMHR